jgi:peptide/nickel transport system permease protein
MTVFLLRRVGWAILVLFVVATLTFVLSHVVPADPAAFLAGQNATADTVARIRAENGLDHPILIQNMS